MKTLTSLLALLIGSSLYAQEANMISFSNLQPIDENRYEGVEGNPYLFKEWASAVIIDLDGIYYKTVLGNYNGYEQEVEISNGDKYINLDQQYYPQVTLADGEDTLLLIPGISAGLKEKWVVSLYWGKEYRLVATKRTVMSEHEIQNVGETIEVKRFKMVTTYYLLHDGKIQKVRMGKKKILELLDHQKEIMAFVKAQKLKLNSPSGLVSVLGYLEAEGLK